MQVQLNNDALVVLSGGQDSTTCLYWAKEHFDEIVAVTFDYGQRHKKEVSLAITNAKTAGVRLHRVISLDLATIVPSALLNSTEDVSGFHMLKEDLPASFVPNRNTLFFTIAHAIAQAECCDHLVAGTCQTDYSGYPDCRDDFIKGLQAILNLGSDSNIIIHTPLMFKTKEETFQMAQDLGCLPIIIHNTLTCYEGNEDMNPWGMGCGKCPACTLRSCGYDQYLSPM